MDHVRSGPSTQILANIKVRTTGHANLIGSQIQAG
jgi:hypothetical protein